MALEHTEGLVEKEAPKERHVFKVGANTVNGASGTILNQAENVKARALTQSGQATEDANETLNGSAFARARQDDLSAGETEFTLDISDAEITSDLKATLKDQRNDLHDKRHSTLELIVENAAVAEELREAGLVSGQQGLTIVTREHLAEDLKKNAAGAEKVMAA